MDSSSNVVWTMLSLNSFGVHTEEDQNVDFCINKDIFIVWQTIQTSLIASQAIVLL